MDALDRIAEAVLYEGYVLWPYTRSARKNQQRWTFGGVYPRAFCEQARSGDAWRTQTEVVVVGANPHVEAELRFLHVVERRVAQTRSAGELEFVDELQSGANRVLAWDEAVERRVALPADIGIPAGTEREAVEGGAIVRSWETLDGAGTLSLAALAPDVWRVTVSLTNTSTWAGSDRTAAQRRSFASAHVILRVDSGAFVSATDPPADLAGHVGACENVGVWPALVGAEGERSTMLASPIILYDYPRIAPESPTLLFDSGEIDQLLMLNTLTLTDAEKTEMRATDPRTRAILDRAESLSAADFASLHGAIRDFQILRSPSRPELAFEDESTRLLGLERATPTAVEVNGTSVSAGSRVRLHPRQGGDIFDLALDGRLATVDSIEQDYEERVHLAVTLADDPGSDLGHARLPGHRFFFSPDELEPV